MTTKRNCSRSSKNTNKRLSYRSKRSNGSKERSNVREGILRRRRREMRKNELKMRPRPKKTNGSGISSSKKGKKWPSKSKKSASTYRS